MTLTAAGCAELQPARPPQVFCAGAVVQRCFPSSMPTATTPPASPGFFSNAPDSETYAVDPSLANPHSMPPSTPPSPACVFQINSPDSGLRPYSAPDFCPASSTRRPSGNTVRIGELEK